MSEQKDLLDKIRFEDSKIFDKINQHDENAISELYDKYAQVLFNFLMRLLRSVEDAENILHDVLIELWNNPKKFQDASTSLFCYLVHATHKRAIASERSKHLKRISQQNPENILPIYSECVLSDAQKLIIPKDFLQSLISLLQQISNDEHQILSLGFYDGLSESEISKRLKIPAWTVNWSLRKMLSSISGLIFGERKNSDEQHKNFLELCAGYAVGVLDNKLEYENHLASGCEICRDELYRFENALAILTFAIPNVTVSSELKERILFSAKLTDVVKSTIEVQPSVKESILENEGKGNELKTKPMKLLIAGIIVGILIVAGGWYVYHLHKTIQRLTEIEKNKIFQIQNDDQRSSSILEVLKSPNIEIVHLKSPEKDEVAIGKLFWDPVSRIAVLNISRLPILDENNNYQFWLRKDEEYISIGVLSNKVEGTNDYFIRIQLPRDVARNDIKSFEITMEPMGGSVEPTGKVFLHGDVR